MPVPITEAEIAEIAERTEKATPLCSAIGDDEASTCNYADPAFIAHAREDIPRLLAALAAKGAELQAEREEHKRTVEALRKLDYAKGELHQSARNFTEQLTASGAPRNPWEGR